jgi:hypothetical protein
MGLYKPSAFNAPAVHRTLLFGHVRADGQPAFAADHRDGAGPRGAIAAATRFAHLCAVATEGRDLHAELDGVRVSGVLRLPAPGDERFPFSPARPVPLPAHATLTLHYTLDGAPFTCACRAAQASGPDAAWLLQAPHAISGPEGHLTPDHVLRAGWRFEPHGDSPLALFGEVRVDHLSLSGAGIVFDHGDSAIEPGSTVSGELVGPNGERFRVLADIDHLVTADSADDEAPVRAELHFRGLGTEPIRRLSVVLRGV